MHFLYFYFQLVMVLLGDTCINNVDKNINILKIKSEIRSSRCSQVFEMETCGSPVSLKERNKTQKLSENASSPISKKDRILQSFAAASPADSGHEVFNKESEVNKKPLISGTKRSLKDLTVNLETEHSSDKRACNSESFDEEIQECKWLLVGSRGKVIVEAAAKKTKKVSLQ